MGKVQVDELKHNQQGGFTPATFCVWFLDRWQPKCVQPKNVVIASNASQACKMATLKDFQTVVTLIAVNPNSDFDGKLKQRPKKTTANSLLFDNTDFCMDGSYLTLAIPLWIHDPVVDYNARDMDSHPDSRHKNDRTPTTLTPNSRKSKDTPKVKEVPGQDSDQESDDDQATPAKAMRAHDKGSRPSNPGSQASKHSSSSSKKKLLGEFDAASESSAAKESKKDKPGSKKRKVEAEPEPADSSLFPEFPDDKSVDKDADQEDSAGEDPAEVSDAAEDSEAAEVEPEEEEQEKDVAADDNKEVVLLDDTVSEETITISDTEKTDNDSLSKTGVSSVSYTDRTVMGLLQTRLSLLQQQQPKLLVGWYNG